MILLLLLLYLLYLLLFSDIIYLIGIFCSLSVSWIPYKLLLFALDLLLGAAWLLLVMTYFYNWWAALFNI